MQVNIRPYNHSDYNMICGWWNSHNEQSPLPGMMVENGTFIYEYDGIPVMSLTVFITQSSIGYIEGYISNPEIDPSYKKICGPDLWNHCFKWAQDNGVKHLLTYTNKFPLVKRYESFGMTKAIDNLTGLFRNVGV